MRSIDCRSSKSLSTRQDFVFSPSVSSSRKWRTNHHIRMYSDLSSVCGGQIIYEINHSASLSFVLTKVNPENLCVEKTVDS